MTKRRVSYINSIKVLLPIIVLLVLGGFLRFPNLGYSEFQDDEKKALVRKKEDESLYTFFMGNRKGPLQFIVTSATLLVTNNPRDEFALRLPFTIFNLLSVIVFYFVAKELFESKSVATLGAGAFLVNGFVVGFSRIAQYQNLNLFFSLLSLLFFSFLAKRSNGYLKNSFLGTLFFSLSLLAHWDAVFYLIPICYFYILFLRRSNVSSEAKLKITVYNFVLGCVLLLPFLIPYAYSQISNEANLSYFDRRIGISDYSWEKHRFIFELYNPYVTLYFLPFFAILGTLRAKKFSMLFFWFIANLFVIRFFMEKPGTHIYNYVIPLIFLATAGFSLLRKSNFIFKGVLLPITFILGLLYYQSFLLFIDNSQEYPWDSKEIRVLEDVNLTTEEYTEKEILTFGFPHFRGWKKVNAFVSSDPDECTYISNEGKEITQIYMDSKYGVLEERDCYYIAVVKKPFNMRAAGAVYAKAHGKKPVYTYKRDGKTLLRLYKISTL